MAVTITNGGLTTSTTNATSYASNSFTPAAGDLLLCFVHVSGNVVIPEMTDSQALGWDYCGSAFDAVSANTIHTFVANTPATAVATTVTFTCVGVTASGAAIEPVRVSGMTKFGSFAIRQTKASSNNAAASTTAIAFSGATLSGNPILGVIGNSTNGATMTPPTGYTELTDGGYATPTTGMESVALAAGSAGTTTVTWASNSASAWGGMLVELDASTTGWTIVQGKLVSKTASAGTTGTVTLATTKTGSMLTAIAVTDAGVASSITGIAATGTANWTKKVDITDGGGASELGWYGYNTSSSATPTLTVTFAASIIGSVFINEYVYYNAGSIVAISTDPFDQLKSATGGASTTPATGNTPALAASGDLLVAGAGTLDSANRYAAGTGYIGASGTQNGTTLDIGFEDGVATSSAAQAAGFTITASDFWGALIMAFKQPGSSVNATVTQVAATVTATGGTQTVATVNNASITQLAATLTATGGTQVIAAAIKIAISQVAATLTVTGGTQTVVSVSFAAITQLAAGVTAAGGTQAIVTTQSSTITQLAATVTATGGTQTAKTNSTTAQLAANVTATGGTQTVATVNIVAITQSAATLTATGGTQVLISLISAAISQLAANVTATGGTQAIVAHSNSAITQVGATLTATTGTQTLTVQNSVVITQVAAILTITGGMTGVAIAIIAHDDVTISSFIDNLTLSSREDNLIIKSQPQDNLTVKSLADSLIIRSNGDDLGSSNASDSLTIISYEDNLVISL